MLQASPPKVDAFVPTQGRYINVVITSGKLISSSGFLECTKPTGDDFVHEVERIPPACHIKLRSTGSRWRLLVIHLSTWVVSAQFKFGRICVHKL